MRKSKQERKLKSQPLQYGLLLLFLMVANVLVFLPVAALVLFFTPPIVSYAFIAVFSLLFGWLTLRVVEWIEHKEKKEMLAGVVIPLVPAILFTIVLTLFTEGSQVFYDLPFVHQALPHPLVAGLLYYVLFNLPFVYFYVEHEKHKHVYAWYFFGPLFVLLAGLYLLLQSRFFG